MDYKKMIRSNRYVLVEFYASWCPHCQRMMTVVDRVKRNLSGSLAVHQFDIDENQALADSQRVDTIPLFILYGSGQELWRKSGEMTEEALLESIKVHV